MNKVAGMDRDEMRKMAVQAESLQRIQKGLKDQIVSISMASIEAGVTMNALSKIKEGDDALVSLGSGIYAKAKISSVDKVLLHIGSGVYGEYSPDKAREILKERIEESKAATNKLEEELKRVQAQLMELERKARQYLM